MKLEDYFDFDTSGEIRIQGHRIWMHDILNVYLPDERTPKELLKHFPSLNLEKIHACLLYYHSHKAAMDNFLSDRIEYGRVCRERQRLEHPEWYERMRQVREQASATASSC